MATPKTTWVSNLRSHLFSMPERAINYVSPLFLLVIEWFLRTAFQLETQTFIGPTMASVGIGFIIPLTAYKKQDNKSAILDIDMKQKIAELEASGIIQVVRTREKRFIDICWVFALGSTALWMWSLVLSTQQPNNTWVGVPVHYVPGFINYFAGIIMSEIKEAI